MIEKFSNIFDGLQAAYGTYKINGRDPKGKATGKATVVKEPRTTELWEAHLAGKQSIGIIPINESNACKWGCIDIDEYNFDHQALIESCKQPNSLWLSVAVRAVVLTFFYSYRILYLQKICRIL